MKEYNAADRFKCLFRKEILVVLPVYFFFLMPATAAAAYLCRLLDRYLGLPLLISWPYNLISFIVLILAGAFIIFWSYTYLVLEGEGGPIPPFSNDTKRLVTTGPYGLVRHPSIIGKLLGVIGLGLLFQSVTFTFILVPLLLLGSLILNARVQEKIAIDRLGDEYVKYRKEVPMIIPRFSKIVGMLKGTEAGPDS